MLTVAFANGIGRIDLLGASEVARHLARVTVFLPRIETPGPDTFAVAFACLVLAAEIVDQHLAIATHEAVVLVRPLLGLASAVGFEIYCTKEGGKIGVQKEGCQKEG